VIFSEDFESGSGVGINWVTDGEFESWSTVDDENFNSRVVIDSAGDYQEDEFSYIRTADLIPARNFRGLNLQFSISYALEQRFDKLQIEISEGESGEYSIIHSLSGFSSGVERMVIWSNDAVFDDFYLRFSLTSDEDANYDGIYLDDILLSGINWKFTGDEYGYKSGTSMATPVVAGVAGLVWSANPGLSCLEVKQILLDSADLAPDLAGKLISGGRVNAEAAVMSALSFSDPVPEPDDASDPEMVPDPEPKPDDIPEPIGGNDNDDMDGALEPSDSGGSNSGCFIFSILQ
jgi:hypothetical protein